MRSLLYNPAILLAIATATLCLLLQALGLEQVLRFDRSSIDSGSWWLLLTGNFVHLNWNHLLLNMTGLVLVVLLVWSNFTVPEWLVIIVLSSIGVGLGLKWLDPGIEWYVGFSGTLHGLIMAGTLADFRRFPVPAALLLLVVCAKLAWEQVYGALPGSESVAGGTVVVNSHLYGAVAGSVIGLLLLLGGRLFRRSKPN